MLLDRADLEDSRERFLTLEMISRSNDHVMRGAFSPGHDVIQREGRWVH